MAQSLAYRRVLLKLSGEILSGKGDFGVEPTAIEGIVKQVFEICEMGVELGIVIGGGNILRWRDVKDNGFERASADYMGMLGTTINALALQSFLEKHGLDTRVLSAIEMRQICEPYIRRRAVRHLEKQRVVIFACGTGNPYFTTDTAASLRAMEVGADILLKGTKVDAIYDRDPEKFPDAVRYDRVSFMEVLQKGLGVMDAAAISLCMENRMPIVVFNINQPGNLKRIVTGDSVGTYVYQEADRDGR
jgi:uridylate kinase